MSAKAAFSKNIQKEQKDEMCGKMRQNYMILFQLAPKHW